MLDHLGLEMEAAALKAAVAKVLAGDVKTPDLGGASTTTEVADAVLAALS
jgi:tartrate dehydrogenase/decarboxylase / D-malate dehydrogenase